MKTLITKTAIIASACDMIETESKVNYLWIYDKLITKKGSAWMPVVDLYTSIQDNSTHKIGEYFFTLPKGELEGHLFAFENYILKHVSIERL